MTGGAPTHCFRDLKRENINGTPTNGGIMDTDENKEEKRCCTLFYIVLQKYVPISRWLPRYTFTQLQCDFISGVTVGLMVVPQGLAYASIARLKPQYGLYSAYMGCFVYCFFGTSKDLTVGPTAILSLMVSIYGYPEDPRYTVTFTLFVGIILFLLGVLRLGFIVKFISVPVLSGFTSAAAITIAAGQLKNLLGLTKISRDFVPGLVDVFDRIKYSQPWDFLFGVSCIILLIVLRQLGRCSWVEEEPLSLMQKVARKFIWFIGIGRNSIVIIISIGVVSCLVNAGEEKYLTLSRDIKAGLPSFQAPSFEMKSGNKTISVIDLVEAFDTGLLVVPLLAFVETVAVGKAFSRKNNYKIDPTQELIAIGLANVMSSFVSSYPVTGSFSRTAVNSQSGVQTPFSGIFTGIVVMVAAEYLTPYFQYIPKACLGAIIISAVLPMVDFKTVTQLWKFRKLELLPLGVTFVACFYTLEFGLLVGILVALFLVLYPVMYPKVDEEVRQVAIIRIGSGVLYPGVEYVVSHVESILSGKKPPIMIILDFSGVTEVDYTFLHELMQISIESRRLKTELYFTNLKPYVRDIFVKADLGCHVNNSSGLLESMDESTRLLM